MTHQTFLKAGWQKFNNVSRPKKINSSLLLFIFERRNVNESRHVLVINRKTPLDSIMIDRFKVMTLLSPFNQWEFSVTGKFAFPKDVYSSSTFLGPTPYRVKSSVLRYKHSLLIYWWEWGTPCPGILGRVFACFRN